MGGEYSTRVGRDIERLRIKFREKLASVRYGNIKLEEHITEYPRGVVVQEPGEQQPQPLPRTEGTSILGGNGPTEEPGEQQPQPLPRTEGTSILGGNGPTEEPGEQQPRQQELRKPSKWKKWLATALFVGGVAGVTAFGADYDTGRLGGWARRWTSSVAEFVTSTYNTLTGKSKEEMNKEELKKQQVVQQEPVVTARDGGEMKKEEFNQQQEVRQVADVVKPPVERAEKTPGTKNKETTKAAKYTDQEKKAASDRVSVSKLESEIRRCLSNNDIQEQMLRTLYPSNLDIPFKAEYLKATVCVDDNGKVNVKVASYDKVNNKIDEKYDAKTAAVVQEVVNKVLNGKKPERWFTVELQF
jgi:hypothetical protein